MLIAKRRNKMDYSKLPIFAEAEIVVCGGGTAGAFAAKAAADMVTVSNEEHAIARVIRDIEEGKIF